MTDSRFRSGKWCGNEWHDVYVPQGQLGSLFMKFLLSVFLPAWLDPWGEKIQKDNHLGQIIGSYFHHVDLPGKIQS